MWSGRRVLSRPSVGHPPLPSSTSPRSATGITWTRKQGSEITGTHYGHHKESRLRDYQHTLWAPQGIKARRLPAHIMGTTRNQGSENTSTHYGHHKESRLGDYQHTLWAPQGIKAQRLPAHIMGTTRNQG